MTVRALPSRRWATASFSANDGTVAQDLSILGAHYQHCNGSKGRWFNLQCAVEALHSFVGPRFMTTVLAIGALAGVGALVL